MIAQLSEFLTMRILFALISISVFVVACGGGGDGGTSTSSNTTYSIGGTLNGLAAGNSITLTNNGTDNLTLTANGPFTFSSKMASGVAYTISISTLPANQPCSLTNSTGAVSVSNIVNVSVICTWTATGNMSNARWNQNATLLTNGKVLVLGGTWGSPSVYSTATVTAELFDPTTGNWGATGSLLTGLSYPTLTVLPSGLVLMAGANGAFGATPSSELYNSTTGIWSATGGLINTQRNGFTSTLLNNGKVMATGGNGCCAALNTSELYDPSTGVWTATGNLVYGREYHTATLLLNGKALVVGGQTWSGSFSAITVIGSTELYDPTTGNWTATGSLGSARIGHTATLLLNGKVLVTGGTGAGTAGTLSSSELYDPTTGNWSATGSLTNSRTNHTATLLPSGKVLVTGGVSQYSTNLSSSELYDPATGTWTETSRLITGRYSHTATLLSNTHVLVTGGYNATAGALSSAELY